MSTHQPTRMAQEESEKLQRTLGPFDILFLMIAAVVGLETLGQVSAFGGEAFTWSVVLVVTFLMPYGMIFAEIGAAFSEEGGAYTWVRTAFGRPAAAIASILTWVTQPVWVGGSMAFLAAETASEFVFHIESGSFGDWAFKIVFIWLTVLAAVISLDKGKWIPTLGAIIKLGLLVVFIGTTVAYAVQNGVAWPELSTFKPTWLGLFGSVPILLFAYLGFESANAAAGEMQNPARDVPISLMRSCATAAACYLIPIFAILLVVPQDEIDGISGLMAAIERVFSVYGGAADTMVTISGVAMLLILVSQGAAWMMVSDRMQAMAAADGAFFGGFFGVFHDRLGTPVRVNMMSGVVATVFLIAASQLTGNNAAVFGVVLTISISTFLLSYLLVIPAAIKLRTGFPEVQRPFRAPVGNGLFAVLGWLCFAWILLGSWVAVFPGTLEQLFGLDYDFKATWGVGRGQFETLTLGTLAVLLILALVGYVLGAPVRAGRTADAAIEVQTGDND